MQSGNPSLTLKLQLNCVIHPDSSDLCDDSGPRIVGSRFHPRETDSRRTCEALRDNFFQTTSRIANAPRAAKSAA